MKTKINILGFFLPREYNNLVEEVTRDFLLEYDTLRKPEFVKGE
jgi:hypothetical protein